MENKKEKNWREIVKTDFDFYWKSQCNPLLGQPTFQYNRGDILDIGCGACQLYNYLKSKGWKGKYYGIDIKEYEGYRYPKEVELFIGDALEIKFPKVDTCVLYDILEHINEPIKLLSKAINSSENVLIAVPKRNEEMWRYGIVEYHQLDKAHKHCGFSKEEVYKLVDLAGGKIKIYKELGGLTILQIRLLSRHLARLLLSAKIGHIIFPKKTFYQEIWCEVIRK
jgi:SAM-dependent methyltransferase